VEDNTLRLLQLFTSCAVDVPRVPPTHSAIWPIPRGRALMRGWQTTELSPNLRPKVIRGSDASAARARCEVLGRYCLDRLDDAGTKKPRTMPGLLSS
jgi:hypothetical protein